jgi:hypothetical protein
MLVCFSLSLVLFGFMCSYLKSTTKVVICMVFPWIGLQSKIGSAISFSLSLRSYIQLKQSAIITLYTKRSFQLDSTVCRERIYSNIAVIVSSRPPIILKRVEKLSQAVLLSYPTLLSLLRCTAGHVQASVTRARFLRGEGSVVPGRA